MKRLLVTTALEETWGDDVPVLFLGEKCRLYSRKHIWSAMDALVAPPFGVEPEQKLSDSTYVGTLTNQILTELTAVLNKYHQIQNNERFWNIVLGHWLGRYVSVAFNRYYTLDRALKIYEVAGTIVFKGADYSLATSDSTDFVRACEDNQWNHAFFLRIMSFRGDMKLNQVPAPSGAAGGFRSEQEIYYRSLPAIELVKKLFSVMGSRGMSIVLLELLGTIGAKFSRDTDAFIIGSYLPAKEDFKLKLALGQVPGIWKSPPFKQAKAAPEQRANLKLNHDNFEGFEKYVRWQLPEVIPACFLEGYIDLIATAKEMPWPKEPKFIFTSNNFDTDEIFKVWTALKVERGTPYFVGQHGNNYGTHAVSAAWGVPERTTCDKFISWGLKERKSDIPAFVFTNTGRKPKQFDEAGGLLLVEGCLPESFYNYDSYYEHILYLEEQFCFVENLPEHIRQRLTVRLHASYINGRFFEDLRWKDRSPHVKVDKGLIAIGKLIGENRLIVQSYDSTGILETLAMNIPTMCFWRDGLNHLLPSAKPYYELLADAGILFYSPEEAAKSIALHWGDISGWWESAKVQGARQKFCEQYARTVTHPVRELKNILTENS